MKKEKVDVKLPESAINFLNYCKNVRELSQDTVDAYERDLRIFTYFLKLNKTTKDRRNINDNYIKSVKIKHLNKFMTYLKDERNNTVYARTRKIATLKAYFSYLQNIERLITVNPTFELRSPKKGKRLPIYLTLEECKMLLQSLKRYDNNYQRDYCIIVLFLQTGMRLSELINIKINDIKGDTINITGKGDKDRTVYLNDVCINAINDYLEVRNDYNIEDDRLFNIKKQRVEQMIKDRIIKADIEDSDKYSVHKLRHTCATLLYKYGNVGVAELKELLGHENISTTNIYTHIDSEQIRDAVKRNPLNIL
jgi:site-specific recombinase XerD